VIGERNLKGPKGDYKDYMVQRSEYRQRSTKDYQIQIEESLLELKDWAKRRINSFEGCR